VSGQAHMKRLLPFVSQIKSSGSSPSPPQQLNGISASNPQPQVKWWKLVAAIALFVIAFSAGHLFGSSSKSHRTLLSSNGSLAHSALCRISETQHIPNSSHDSPTSLEHMEDEGSSGHNNVELTIFVQSTTTPATELALATWLHPSVFRRHAEASPSSRSSTIEVSTVLYPSSEVARDGVNRAVMAVFQEALNVTIPSAAQIPMIQVAPHVMPSSTEEFLSIGAVADDSSPAPSMSIRGHDRRSIVQLVAHHVCPYISSEQQNADAAAGNLGTNRTTASWYVYTHDNVLVSIPAVVSLTQRHTVAQRRPQQQQPAVVWSGVSSDPSDASVTSWISAKLRRRSITTDGVHREEGSIRFFLISGNAARRLCSAMKKDRKDSPVLGTATKATSLVTPPSACLRQFASVRQFISSIECFQELGIDAIAHQGIVVGQQHPRSGGRGKNAASLASPFKNAVSNIIAIDDVSTNNWAYYHYFLNLFRRL
jgi:hypothetical protein